MDIHIQIAAAPRVEACIAAVMRRFPSEKSTAYFTAVHQHLAPLARELEAENLKLKAEVARLRAADDAAIAGCRP